MTLEWLFFFFYFFDAFKCHLHYTHAVSSKASTFVEIKQCIRIRTSGLGGARSSSRFASKTDDEIGRACYSVVAVMQRLQ